MTPMRNSKQTGTINFLFKVKIAKAIMGIANNWVEKLGLNSSNELNTGKRMDAPITTTKNTNIDKITVPNKEWVKPLCLEK